MSTTSWSVGQEDKGNPLTCTKPIRNRTVGGKLELESTSLLSSEISPTRNSWKE